MLPGPAGLDHHAHPVTVLRARHELHRCTEIGDIESAAQVFRQGGTQELHHQRLALLADIHTDLIARQVNHYSTCPISPTAEVNVLQRLRTGVQRFGKSCRGAGCGSRCRRGGGRIEYQQKHLAFELRLVVGRLLEIEHQACSFASLCDAHGSQIALVDLDAGATERVTHTGQVNRDARRGLDREAGWNRRQRLGQFNSNHLGTRLLRAVDGLNRILGGHQGGRADKQRQRQGTSAPLAHHRMFPLVVHRAFS